MAPIIVSSASSDEDTPNFNLIGTVISKEKLCIDALSASGAGVAEGRDDQGMSRDDAGDDAAAAEPGNGDGGNLGQNEESSVANRQSNLFAADQLPTIQTSYLGNVEKEDVYAPPSDAFIPGLSLMPSSSPASSFGVLEDVDFDESKWVQSQIDADEELARQLQGEEDKKKPKPKTRVVPSVADSLFGEPLTWEVRGNYTKVESSSSGSVSGSMAMLTKSFKKWGNEITTAANDFFGEDISMQVRNQPDSQYRNAV